MAAPDKPSRKSRIKDPLSLETWRTAALVAVLAWAGVGADSLSSANYGPEEAYKALHQGGHEPLVIWLALITALTVLVISLAYVQIIRLFPNGGGGYKAATRLVHAADQATDRARQVGLQRQGGDVANRSHGRAIARTWAWRKQLV